jgi:hypothetical protein
VQIKRESCSSPISQCEEPTDLTTTGGREREERERERIERERYYSQLMERYNIDRGSPSRSVTIIFLFNQGCGSGLIFTDPDPAFLLNPDPDPVPDPS